MKNKEYYNKIFEEYKELIIRNHISSNNLEKGNSKTVIPNELMRIEEIEKELDDNLNFLSNEQLKFLYENDDSNLKGKALQIWLKRLKLNNYEN